MQWVSHFAHTGEELILIHVIWKMRFPESWWPGKFDMCSSHSFMHILVVCAAVIQLVSWSTLFSLPCRTNKSWWCSTQYPDRNRVASYALFLSRRSCSRSRARDTSTDNTRPDLDTNLQIRHTVWGCHRSCGKSNARRERPGAARVPCVGFMGPYRKSRTWTATWYFNTRLPSRGNLWWRRSNLPWEKLVRRHIRS